MTSIKRTISIIISMAILALHLPGGFITASAESGTCGDNLTWTLDDTGVLTISGTGDMTDFSNASNAPWKNKSFSKVIINSGVTSIGDDAFSSAGLTSIEIPDSVTSIGDSAFMDCRGLTSVTIGNGVTSIGDYAFYRCYGLTSVTIGDSVTRIGDWAFGYCRGLTSVTIPNSVTRIGDSAFYGCAGLTSVTIPDSVTRIGDSAFCHCTSLTSVTIGNGVTSIGGGAFEDCPGLTSITIPDSVTSIGQIVFRFCTGLTSITVEYGNPIYHSAGNCIIETESKTLIAGCNNSVIPTDGSVTSIGIYAFYGCDGLTSVTIPDSVTSIGYGAFMDCTGLTRVTIPDSVTSIGGYAFWGCKGLTSVTIGNGVTSIGYHAFYRCTGLTSVTIPDSVTSIGSNAFEYCTGLTSVTIPDSVTSIGSEAFRYCSGLTSVTIPNSVTRIGKDAFANCKRLVLRVVIDSYAHRYAVEDGISYSIADLSTISIYRLPDKTIYIEGEALDVDGGRISLKYEDDTTDIIYMTADMVNGFDNTKVGPQTLTVAYEGKTATFDVMITAKELTGAALTAVPDKLTYLEYKDTLDLAGGNVTLYYNNDTSEVIDLTADMVTGFDNTKVGLQTLTVTYEGMIATFDVEIVAKTLTEIVVTTLPEKMAYLEDKDTLSVNGGKVTLYYNNDTSEVIDLTADMVSGFDNTKVGPQTLTVTYEDKTTTFDVTIVAKSLTGIAVTAVPNKFSYLEGKDALDVSGGKVSLYYDNGTFEVIDMTLPMVSGFDNTKVGSQTLKVEYHGFTATFSVTIVAKQVSQIAIFALPNKLRYLVNKDSLDITGGILKLYYDNDTTRDAYMVYNNGYKLMFADDFTLADLSVTGFDNTEVGTKTIVVRYGGKSTTFNVEILDKTLIRFEMTAKPTKTEYIKGEQLDLSGAAIKLYYDNGEVQTASVISVMGNHRMIISGSSSSEEIVVDGFFGNNSGRQTVTLTYNGCSDSFVVKVRGENVIYGDPDGDGEIGVTDALMSMRAVLGIIIVIDGDVFVAADVDDDGVLTVSDALRMLRMAAGLPIV